MAWFARLFSFSLGDEKHDFTDPNMKYLIVGLGNIGHEYNDTRHNIGFDAVDFLAAEQGAAWSAATHGDIASFKHKSRFFLLLKPSTYMNLSGKAIRYWMGKEKIQPENLLVVLDDLNLPFGKLRLRPSGSDGGHNGLKSIQELLATPNYARLRIGIGDDFKKGRQVNFVLGKWSEDERVELPRIMKNCAEAIKTFGVIGIAQAMSQFNSK